MPLLFDKEPGALQLYSEAMVRTAVHWTNNKIQLKHDSDRIPWIDVRSIWIFLEFSWPMDWHSETSGFTRTGKCQGRPCGCTWWINFTFPCTRHDLQKDVIKWDDRDGVCTASSNLAFKQRAGRDVPLFFFCGTPAALAHHVTFGISVVR